MALNTRLTIRISVTLLVVLSLVIISTGSARAQTWVSMAEVPSPRGQASVVQAQDGLIYVIGGCPPGYSETGCFDAADQEMAVDTVEAYNPETDTWTTKEPLPFATRAAASALGPNGRIYVFDGVVHSTQIYDPVTDTWSSGAPTPTDVWSAGATMGLDGLIYVIGGEVFDGTSSPSALVQIYDPDSDSWTSGAPMSVPRREHRVVLGPNGLVYAMGGINGDFDVPISSIEAYDPSANTWEMRSAMPAARVWMGVTSLCSTTYLIGGGDGVTYLGTNERVDELDPTKVYVFGGGETYVNNGLPVYADTFVYDPYSDTWSVGPAMSTARREHGAAVCPPLIEVDTGLAIDRRVDIGTPARILFHGRWAHDGSAIASTIQINGTDYSTNSTGWIEFEYISQEVAELTFVVSAAKSGGVTFFKQTTPPVSVVWDTISVQLVADDERVNVGSTAQVSWTAVYVFDQKPFNGTIVISAPLTAEDVGLLDYDVAEVDDPLYDLTSFITNRVSVVFDRIEISLSVNDSRIDVGDTASIEVAATYAYDGQPLSGSVSLNDSLHHQSVGVYGYTVLSVTDELHGLSVFESTAVSIVFDRVQILLSAVDSRVDVASAAEILWEGYYEYDGEAFEGSVELNESLFQSSVGRFAYAVLKIDDGVYGLSAFLSDEVFVVFDRVVITLHVVDGRVDVGSDASIDWEGVYEYDGASFYGSVTFDQETMKSQVGRYLYSVKEISDPLYGLAGVTANEVYVIFDRVVFSLEAGDERINLGDTADIIWSGIYEYDTQPFEGTVQLDPALSQSEVGSYSFSIVSIEDEAYGLTTFIADSVKVIFDRVHVDLQVSDSRIDIGSSAAIEYEAFYEYDGLPFEGSVVFNGSLVRETVGLYWFTASEVTDVLHGLTAFRSNSVSVVFDRVLVNLTTLDERIDVDSKAEISLTGRYEFDGEPLRGEVLLNRPLTQSEVGMVSYTVSSVRDEVYDLTVFVSNTVSVVFDRVSIHLSVDDDRIDVGSSAAVTWTGTYEYDGSRFQGSVSLDNALTRDDVGMMRYGVLAIEDPLHGITVFEANQVEVIFDMVSIELSVSDSRVGMGSSAEISVNATYLFDGTPFDGDVIFSQSLTKNEVGQYSYEVVSVHGDSHGISQFESSSVSVIFDRIIVELSAPEKWTVGSSVPINWSAYYEFDGAPFPGTIVLSEDATPEEPGTYEFSVAGVEGDPFQLAVFGSRSVTVTVEERLLKPGAATAVAGLSVASALAVGVSNAWSRVQNVVVEAFGRLSSSLPEPLVDVVKYFLEGVLETKGVVEVKSAEAPFILTREELFPLSFAGLALALAFSYGLAPSLGDILTLLPLTLTAAVSIELSKEVARELVARRTGNWSEYRIWPLGLISMVISTVLFRAPFSVPGKSWFHMSSPSKRSEGMIATASSAVGFLAAGVFFLLVMAGERTIGSMGLSISLALALYELIPTAPLNGKAVFDWNKPLWTALFAAALVLYVLHITLLA